MFYEDKIRVQVLVCVWFVCGDEHVESRGSVHDEGTRRPGKSIVSSCRNGAAATRFFLPSSGINFLLPNVTQIPKTFFLGFGEGRFKGEGWLVYRE